MTAGDRICVLFLLPHVFGHRALDLPEELREPFLTVIARVQLILISTRGCRSYNVSELNEIFERGWVILFGALEEIHARAHRIRFAKQMNKHRKDPEKHKAPKPFTRTTRYVQSGGLTRVLYQVLYHVIIRFQ